MTHRKILKYFKHDHLPEVLQEISYKFSNLAAYINTELPLNEESDIALRKLLEAKDAAVRSKIEG